MEKQQRKRSDGLDSVKTGVEVLFPLRGGRTEGDREGHQRLGMVREIQKVNFKKVYLCLETWCFQGKKGQSISRS